MTAPGGGRAGRFAEIPPPVAPIATALPAAVPTVAEPPALDAPQAAR